MNIGKKLSGTIYVATESMHGQLAEILACANVRRSASKWLLPDPCPSSTDIRYCSICNSLNLVIVSFYKPTRPSKIVFKFGLCAFCTKTLQNPSEESRQLCERIDAVVEEAELAGIRGPVAGGA